MRFAVLSDIHSNYAALRAVIADAESRQPDYWLFLGDYVTDCPYPHRTVEFLRDFSQTHSCLMIRGNREDYMINQRKAPQAWNTAQNAERSVTATRISPAETSTGWLRSRSRCARSFPAASRS